MEAPLEGDIAEKRYNSIKYQLSVQRTSLASKEGRFSLAPYPLPTSPARTISTFKELGAQPRLKILDISKIQIKSLDTLPGQPNLRVLIADHTAIESYAGLSRHPKLRSISFLSTPLASKPAFELSCLICACQNLRIINGRQVKPEQREEANQYPVIARDLIERFWVVERPVPSVKEFRRLGKLHRLKVERGEEVQTGIPADKILRPPPVVPIFRERGKVEVAEVSSEGVGEEEVETDQGGTLVRSLCEKLGEIGLNVRQTPEDVERAIGRLIELVRGIEEYTVLPDSEPALAGPREE